MAAWLYSELILVDDWANDSCFPFRWRSALSNLLTVDYLAARRAGGHSDHIGGCIAGGLVAMYSVC